MKCTINPKATDWYWSGSHLVPGHTEILIKNIELIIRVQKITYLGKKCLS